MLEADVEVDRREFTLRAAVSVRPGERLALFGPSGAGKTTLLETVAGLVQPARGRIALAGRVLTSTGKPAVAIPAWRRQVGLLRQDPGLFPHMSVRDNLRYAHSRGDTPRHPPGPRQIGAELAEVAEALGIAGLLDAMPARLSGGQRHRVALGRLLLAHCQAMLLDEPYSGLDAALRRAMTALVVAMVTQRQVPAVLVTHELADAQAFASQLAVLDHGAILQVGRPDTVVLRPASRRVAQLVGYLGFLPAGDNVAGIHPDRVVAGAAAERGLVAQGIVRGSRPSGAGWEVDLDVSGTVITCRLADQPAADGGELVVTVLDPPMFAADGTAIGAAGAPLPAGELGRR